MHHSIKSVLTNTDGPFAEVFKAFQATGSTASPTHRDAQAMKTETDSNQKGAANDNSR